MLMNCLDVIIREEESLSADQKMELRQLQLISLWEEARTAVTEYLLKMEKE